MDRGYSLSAFAGSIGVAVDTVYHWAATRSDFEEAVAIARAGRVLWLEGELLKAETMPRAKWLIETLKRAALHEYSNKKHRIKDH